MEENRQNFRNRENDRENIESEDKKQFYALNLTPERIFLIFIFFIIFVSILIMIFAFVISNSSKKRAEEIENQSEYVFTTNNSANESSLNSSNETINTQTNENTNTTSSNDSQQNSQTIDNSQKKDNQTTEQQPKPETKPTVNIKNETIYSSNMIKKEPVKTTSNTTITTQTNSSKKTENSSNTTSSKPKINTTATTKKETPQNQNNQKTSYVTKYIIQIASYSTKKQAEDVGKFYSNMGYKTYIKDFVKDGKTFYRLRIGPFDEKKDAETALSKIKTTTYGKDAFISEGKFQK